MAENEEDVKKFLEETPEGLPLRDIRKEFPEMNYYQIYNFLTSNGYVIIDKLVKIEKTVKFIEKIIEKDKEGANDGNEDRG